MMVGQRIPIAHRKRMLSSGPTRSRTVIVGYTVINTDEYHLPLKNTGNEAPFGTTCTYVTGIECRMTLLPDPQLESVNG